jgi:aminoglycoside phosphotransferase (APT) family kinase protein
MNIDRAWLTAALRRCGVLTEGEVTRLSVRRSDAFNSTTVFLRATYEGAETPARLVLKRPSAAGWSRAAAAVEVRFYRQLAEWPDHPPITPPCLGTGEPDDDPYVLLEDLSRTHVAPVTRDQTIALRGVPTTRQLDLAVDTIARLHAYWWMRATSPFPRAEPFASVVERRQRAWLRVRAQLPQTARQFYEYILSRASTVDTSDRPHTLVHGDAYLSNFLVPRKGNGPAILLDWQSPTMDIGALDLANLCATFWTREQRRTLESRVLHRYHETLDRGDYPYDQLRADYRIAVLDWLLVPVQDAADGASPAYWQPKMRCLLEAAKDLEIPDLIS